MHLKCVHILQIKYIKILPQCKILDFSLLWRKKKEKLKKYRFSNKWDTEINIQSSTDCVSDKHKVWDEVEPPHLLWSHSWPLCFWGGTWGDTGTAHLDTQVSQLRKNILEEFAFLLGKLGRKDHPNIRARGGSHHVREHVDPGVAQQDWGIRGHQGVKPVTNLKLEITISVIYSVGQF